MDPFHDSEGNLQKFMGKVPDTFPKTNITPETFRLGDYFPFGKAYFRAMLVVSGGVSILSQYHGIAKIFTSCFWGCDV